ncbi:hypothetical protein RvY_10119 [Ramazzottius varieornatus]|uniref:Uncharacterized protein n=1 Tax=Ramazzottius varieornatus TaxID=947166 RepID=A0A1D1VJH8_RAMVA|nr:hypothetical protein RvY_10119 [Ramazzottius varieornatus]
MNDSFNASLGFSYPNKSPILAFDCRQVGQTIWYLRVAAQGFLFAVSSLANLPNLIVFLLWKQKEPYLGFHMALSLCGFACAFCGLALATDTASSGGPVDFRREFYKFHQIYSSRKSVMAVTVGVFFFVSVQHIVIYTTFRHHWITIPVCGVRSSTFAYQASWYRIYYGAFLTILKYLLLVPTQVRLCWMGVRLKRRKNRRVMFGTS